MTRRRRRKHARTRTTTITESATTQSSQPANARSDAAVRLDRASPLIFVGVVVAMVLAGVAYAAFVDDDSTPSTQEVPGVTTFNYQGGDHTDDDVAYAEVPPAGGPHADVWQNCGFYDAPVIDEQAVHALEHGAVWITYRPDLDAAQRSTLEALADGQDYVLVSPYPGLNTPVVASAWNHQLRVDSATDPRLTEFIRAYRLSRSAPEPGAPCTGGSSSVASTGEWSIVMHTALVAVISSAAVTRAR